MTSLIYLPLRDYRHRLKVMKRPDGPGLMLARYYPDDQNHRERVIEQWGLPARSIRQGDDETIGIPLDTREQTIYALRNPDYIQSARMHGSAPSSSPRQRHSEGDHPPTTLLGAPHCPVSAPETCAPQRRRHGASFVELDATSVRKRSVGTHER